MSSTVVLDGLKSLMETEGYIFLLSGTEKRDGFFVVKPTGLTPSLETSISRIIGNFSIELYKKVKINDRFNFEKEVGVIAENLINKLQSGFSSFCVNLAVENVDIEEENNMKTITINTEILYGV